MPRTAPANSEAHERFLTRQAINAFADMQQRQSPKRAVIGSMIGSLLAMMSVSFIAFYGYMFVWMFFIPAWFIGHLAGQWGCLYQRKYALIPAVIASVSHCLLVMALQDDAISLLTVPITFAVGFYSGQMQLNEAQQRALWRKELGRI
ncbi:hypothetical protein [Shewanella maritima]|uniref:hypothetical protein n=1 Tax=Shewanella maritima TaxID=2520507 RepID=UPI0037351FDF